MINSIIRTFYNIAREHKLIRQFKYDRLSKGSGIGEENHPLLFLEDPIYVGDSTLNDGSVRCTINLISWHLSRTWSIIMMIMMKRSSTQQ